MSRPGLLDRTHLRFFTRREIEKLFFRAGFAMEEMRSVCVPGDDDALETVIAAVQVGRLSIGGLSPQTPPSITRISTSSVRGRRAVPDFGLTSIVIVTHNQLEYTRQCLESIGRLTDEPYELIVVETARPTDGGIPAGEGRRAADRQRDEPRVSGRGQPGDRGVARQPGPAVEQ